MPHYKVRPALDSEQLSVVSTIVMAFSADPAARWVYPDPERYLTHFPEFVKAFGGRAFAARTAHIVDGVGAAALWLPPDVHPDQERLVLFPPASLASAVLISQTRSLVCSFSSQPQSKHSLLYISPIMKR